jgi:four helix bundle protein
MVYSNLLFDLSNTSAIKIFKKTLTFPQKYQYSVGDQLRRASLSVVLNIVEGGARISPNEKRQFMNISYGSLKETKYLLYKVVSFVKTNFY